MLTIRNHRAVSKGREKFIQERGHVPRYEDIDCKAAKNKNSHLKNNLKMCVGPLLLNLSKVLPPGKSGQGVELTTHFHIVSTVQVEFHTRMLSWRVQREYYSTHLLIKIQGVDKIMEKLDNMRIKMFMLAALQFPLFIHRLYVCKVCIIKSITKNVVITFRHIIYNWLLT